MVKAFSENGAYAISVARQRHNVISFNVICRLR